MLKENHNKIGNYFYDISHRIFTQGGEISKDIGVEIQISKVEIIGETNQKFRIKFSKLNHIFNKVKNELEVKEKLYKKEEVDIPDIASLDELIQKFNNYKDNVQKSDRISEYHKKAILEAFERFNEEQIREIFSEKEINKTTLAI